MKELLSELSKRYPTLKDSMLSALKNEAQYSLWNMAPVPPNSPMPAKGTNEPCELEDC